MMSRGDRACSGGGGWFSVFADADAVIEARRDFEGLGVSSPVEHYHWGDWIGLWNLRRGGGGFGDGEGYGAKIWGKFVAVMED